ncbi:hypothetical protein JXA34_02775 [Patescibacteria group bacterium]|nr:hypothetical protein [Patescibacteria group bacterium]
MSGFYNDMFPRDEPRQNEDTAGLDVDKYMDILESLAGGGGLESATEKRTALERLHVDFIDRMQQDIQQAWVNFEKFNPDEKRPSTEPFEKAYVAGYLFEALIMSGSEIAETDQRELSETIVRIFHEPRKYGLSGNLERLRDPDVAEVGLNEAGVREVTGIKEAKLGLLSRRAFKQLSEDRGARYGVRQIVNALNEMSPEGLARVGLDRVLSAEMAVEQEQIYLSVADDLEQVLVLPANREIPDLSVLRRLDSFDRYKELIRSDSVLGAEVAKLRNLLGQDNFETSYGAALSEEEEQRVLYNYIDLFRTVNIQQSPFSSGEIWDMAEEVYEDIKRARIQERVAHEKLGEAEATILSELVPVLEDMPQEERVDYVREYVAWVNAKLIKKDYESPKIIKKTEDFEVIQMEVAELDAMDNPEDASEAVSPAESGTTLSAVSTHCITRFVQSYSQGKEYRHNEATSKLYLSKRLKKHLLAWESYLENSQEHEAVTEDLILAWVS